MKLTIRSEDAMNLLGQTIGRALRGGEVLELIGDVGAGKTTLTKGVARAMEINEPVQSPTFTISRVYDARDKLQLCHYDFYRLNEAGVMADELAESIEQPHVVTVVEWGDIVAGVLPADRLRIHISVQADDSRQVMIESCGERAERLAEAVEASS